MVALDRLKQRLRDALAGPNTFKVVTNAGWLYADQALRALLGVLVFSFVTRSLGPEQFGVLSYALAFPGIFIPLAMLGLDYVVIRDFVRHPGQREKIFSTAFSLKTGAALAAAGLAALVVGLMPVDPDVRKMLLIASFSLLFQPLLTMDFFFQSQVASKYSALARMVAGLIGNGLRAWLAFTHAPVTWFVWVFLTESAVYAVSLVFAWRAARVGWIHPWKEFDRAVMRRLLAGAWPLLLADVAIVGYLKFDQILLSHVAGPDVLGRYAAAFRMADYAEFFALALINSYFPRIIQQHQEHPGAWRSEFDRFFGRMTWFSMLVAVMVTLAAPLAASWVLGPKFGPVWPVLVVLAWANVFVTQIAVRGKWFLLEELQVYSLAFFAIGAGVHLVLLTSLAPRWGALGAAVSFLAAQVVMAVIAPLLFSRSRPASALALRSFPPPRI